jgi:hypothetical protein
MIDAWTGASRDRKQLEPGLSQMNEKPILGHRIFSDDFWLRANWRAVHAFNRATSNQKTTK